MSEPVLRLRRVTKSFGEGPDRLEVLREVDLSMEGGERVSLVGASGSGKSTLLSLVAGVLTADSGTLTVCGRSLGDMGERERAGLRASEVGVVMQSDNLIPFLSARENVELALELGGSGRGRADRARALLGDLGLADRLDHRPRHLSGGEAQRASLAVALANEPSLLLADEAVGQLDTETAGVVVDRIFETGRAVLLVTHDPAVASRADRCLTLTDGAVA